MSCDPHDSHCITCGDVAVELRVVRIDEEEAIATRRLLEQMGAEYEQELQELQESLIE